MNYAEVFDYYVETIRDGLAMNVDVPALLKDLERNEYWNEMVMMNLHGQRDCQPNVQCAYAVLQSLTGVAVITRRKLLEILPEEEACEELLPDERERHTMTQDLRTEVAIHVLRPVARVIMGKLWKHNYGAAELIDAEAKRAIDTDTTPDDVRTFRYLANELLNYLRKKSA